MPREGADISANQRAFILEAMQKNVRLDGRSFDEFRPLDLTFGSEYGHAKVQLGKTRYVPLFSTCPLAMRFLGSIDVANSLFRGSVIVRISADLTMPRAERESDGIFTISLELNDMAYPGYEAGRYDTILNLSMASSGF